MANSIMTASCKIDGFLPAITNQNGDFATIITEGAGQYLVTMDDEAELEAADVVQWARDFAGTPVGSPSQFSAIELVSATQFRIRTGSTAGALDGSGAITISRNFRG